MGGGDGSQVQNILICIKFRPISNFKYTQDGSIFTWKHSSGMHKLNITRYPQLNVKENPRESQVLLRDDS